MPQIELLMLLLAVAAGLVGLNLLGRLAEGFPHPFVRSLRRVLVAFNLLILFALVFRYLQLHFLDSVPANWILWALWLSLTALSVLKLVFLFFLVEMNTAFFGRTLPAGFRRIYLLLSGAVILLLATVSAWEGPGVLPSAELGLRLFENLFLVATILVTVIQLRKSFGLAGAKFRMAGWTLGTLHLSLFGTAFLLFSTGMLDPDFMELVGSLSVFFYNLLIVVWSQRFVPALFRVQLGREAGEELLSTFGVTPRELEVIELICRGQTNQEIADALFISLQTVKDHNYSIFKKLAVRNRVELAQKFSRVRNEISIATRKVPPPVETG